MRGFSKDTNMISKIEVCQRDLVSICETFTGPNFSTTKFWLLRVEYCSSRGAVQDLLQ